MKTLPRVAISIGDPAGIGPEIALKAALSPEVRKVCRPLLVGDRTVLEAQARACGIATPIRSVLRADDAAWNDREVTLVERRQFAVDELHIGAIAAPHGEAALDSARAAIEAALSGKVDAVVAAPHTGSAIKLAGIAFDGYPSFVARCTGISPEDAFLMICFRHGGAETRIVHATPRVGLRRAIELITRDRVLNAIRSADTALRRIGVARPRIAVSALNPQSRDSAMAGDEEREIIGPAIGDATKNGIAAEGPFDTGALLLKKDFDAIVVMIHEQMAAKAQVSADATALVIGTPIAFASVMHGSALDIAGKNRADPGAIIAAIRRLVGA